MKFFCFSTTASIQVAKGCYRDRSGSGRAMPDLLASYRKNGLDWSNLDETVIQKCRKEAEERVGLEGDCKLNPQPLSILFVIFPFSSSRKDRRFPQICE